MWFKARFAEIWQWCSGWLHSKEVLGLNPQAGGILCSVCMLSLYLIGFSGYSDSKFAVAVNVIWIRGEEMDGWKIF